MIVFQLVEPINTETPSTKFSAELVILCCCFKYISNDDITRL